MSIDSVITSDLRYYCLIFYILTPNYRYFKSGSEDYRKFLYTWWHGKLAEYFEQVENHDRKAEVNFVLFNY